MDAGQDSDCGCWTRPRVGNWRRSACPGSTFRWGCGGWAPPCPGPQRRMRAQGTRDMVPADLLSQFATRYPAAGHTSNGR